MEVALLLYLTGAPIVVLMPDVKTCYEAIIEARRDVGPVRAECGLLAGITVVQPSRGRERGDFSPPKGCKWSATFVEC